MRKKTQMTLKRAISLLLIMTLMMVNIDINSLAINNQEETEMELSEPFQLDPSEVADESQAMEPESTVESEVTLESETEKEIEDTNQYEGVENESEMIESESIESESIESETDLELDKKAPRVTLVPDEAVVGSINFQKVVDGKAPFDANNDPGNDKDDSNLIVRSYDRVTYIFEYSMELKKDTIYDSFDGGTAYAKIVLPTTKDIATFDTGAMLWLDQSSISVVEENGVQIITGKQELIKSSSGTAIPGTQKELNIEIKVYGAANGDIIQPNITLWLEGNEEDPNHESQEAKQATAPAVTVSAAPKYNIKLAKSNNLENRGRFDLDTGEAATSASTNVISGRMYGYGVTVQLYNDSPAKGLMGIEIPKGEITFDVEMKLEEEIKGVRTDVTDIYSPMLWDYKTNWPSNRGNLDRNLFWEGVQSNTFAASAAPRASEDLTFPFNYNTVYKGGTYEAAQVGHTISVTVDNYEFNTDFFPYRDYNDDNGRIYDKYVGSFTAGYLQIIAQFPDSTEEGVDYYFTVSDKNIKATSKSDVKVQDTQMLTTDDSITTQVMLLTEGTYTRFNWVSEQKHYIQNPKSMGLYSFYTVGNGWTNPDTDIRIYGGFGLDTKNDSENWVYSVNILQKFDDEAFEIPAGSHGGVDGLVTEKNTDPSGFTYTLLYAAKPDGTGWFNDKEMDNAMEEDLVYYASIDELNATGATCVAVLIEGRDGIAKSGIEEYIGFNVHVKETAEIGKVYASTNEVRYWTEKNQLTPEYTRLNSKVTSYPHYAHYYLDYEKSVYKDGLITGGHTGTYVGGQSVLIVGASAKITKGVEQKSGNSQKNVYSMDAGERRIDYVLTPSLVTKTGNTTGIRGTLTITDTLPANVSYIPGSSVFGGTYIVDDTINGGSVDGGISFEPKVTINANKTTTLVWIIPDVEADQPLEELHFSSAIGTPENPNTDVKNAESITNNVKIQSDIDNQYLITGINRDNVTVRVSKYSSTQLVKTVEKPIYEMGEDIVYYITYDNTSVNPISNITLLDILPYKADGRYTNYNGKYWIDCIEIDGSLISSQSNLNVSYTEDASVRTKHAQNVDMSNWTMVPVNTTAEGNLEAPISTPNNEVTPTAFAITGTLGASESIRVKITLKVRDNMPNDIYGNDATVYAEGETKYIATNIVQAKVVRRTIEGVAWLDANRNGKRDYTELRFANVKVVLRDENGNEVTTDVTDKPFGDVYTNANGEYQFTNLPEGKYQVTFESSSTVNLSDYTLTEQKAAGVNEMVNSDAEAIVDGQGDLVSAIIKELKLPAIADMNMHDFRISEQDAGFYVPVIFTKTSDLGGGTLDENGNAIDLVAVEEGQVITYTLEINSPTLPLTNIIVSDKIPAGLSYVQGSLQYQLAGGNVVSVSDEGYDQVTNTIQWPEENLPKGISKFSFKAVVDKLPAGMTEKTFANFGTMVQSGNDYEYPNTQTITHKVVNRKAEIHKTSAVVEVNENDVETILPKDPGSVDTPVEVQRRQTIEYYLTVKNVGQKDSKSENLIVTDMIPEGAIYVPGSMTVVFGSSNDPNQPIANSTAAVVLEEYTDISAETGSPAVGVKWVLSGLSDGESAYLSFRVTAPVTTDDPSTPEYETEAVFTNTAKLLDEELSKKVYEETFTDKNGVTHQKGDKVYELTEFNKDSETTYHKVREPLVTAVKSSFPASPGADGGVPVVKVGDTITYSIALTNSGSTSAKNVNVRDMIPDGTTYVNGSADLGGVLSNIVVESEEKERLDWLIDEIQVGDTITVSFSVIVESLDSGVGAQLIKNIGLYKVPDETLPEVPEDPANPDEDYKNTNEVLHQVSTFVKYSTPMGGSDQSDATYIKQGQAIQYTLQLNSEEVLKGITISDVVPQGLAFVPGSITYTHEGENPVSVPDSAYDKQTGKITWPMIDSKVGITKFEFKVVVDKLPEGTYGKLYSNQAVLEFADGNQESMETNTVTHKTNMGVVDIHKTATTIIEDNDGNETTGTTGEGSQDAPIATELGQIVEYKLTVNRTADKENISGDIRVIDFLPEGTTFVDNTITGTITSAITGSKAVIKSMEFKMITDENGIDRPGVEWILNGLADTEVVELTFRVRAPQTTDNSATDEYETSRLFTNTATVEDEELKNLVYEEDTLDHSKDENIYTSDEYIKESETTYHIVKSPLLEISKSSDLENQSTVLAGDSITYSITVTNRGEGDAFNVITRDTVPEFTSYVQDSAKSTKEETTIFKEMMEGKETLIWIVDQIATGESVTLSFTVTVDEADQEGSREITNTAQVKIPDQGIDLEEAAKDDNGFADTNQVIHNQVTKTTPGKIPGKTPGTSKNPGGAKPTKTVQVTAPKTGDTTMIVWVLVSLMMSGCALVLMARKKRNEK